MKLLQKFVECRHILGFGPGLKIARPRPPRGVAAEWELVGRGEVATAAVGQADDHREGKRTGLLDRQAGAAVSLARDRADAEVAYAQGLELELLCRRPVGHERCLARIVFLPTARGPIADLRGQKFARFG